MSAPQVSVIIATYNRAPFLGEALASILAQTFADYEIIVADDGSTDDTAARVASFDAPIRYLRLEHSGRPSVARNRALAVVRGGFIAFLDDDDLWRPAKLARQVQALTGGDAPDFVYSDMQFLYADGALSPPVLTPRQKRSGHILTHLFGDCFIYPSTVLMRRAVLDTVGWFDESMSIGEDYDLWLRMAYAARAGFVAEPLVLVRRHASTISRRRELETYRNVITSLERAHAGFDLSLGQRVRLRRALARMHTHLGLLLMRRQQAAEARRHFLDSLRVNPFQCRAWLALVESRR